MRLLVKGNFNSFRISGGIRYHRTYHIPSKTTLIGLLGAAMGLDDLKLSKLFSSLTTNAILAKYSGTASDLWLVTKLKTHAEAESAPIIREMLFEPEYWIYYSNTDDSSYNQLDDIINAFYDPEYALTLGRSDEMIEILEIRKVTLKPISSGSFKNTILPFNYKDYFDGYENMSLQKGQTFTLPNIVTIPLSFEIESKGSRTPSKYLQATMVYDIGVKIKGREDGITDEQRKLFLY